MRSNLLQKPEVWFPRDAVHIAIIPAVAKVALANGEHVKLEDGKAVPALAEEAIGVVNPFIPRGVEPDECFWLLLKPETVSGLRHDWSHKDFPMSVASTEEERRESEEWLRDFVGNDRATGEPMYLKSIEELVLGPSITIYGSEVRSLPDEFWHHVERFTGRSFAAERGNYIYVDCRC